MINKAVNREKKINPSPSRWRNHRTSDDFTHQGLLDDVASLVTVTDESDHQVTFLGCV